MHHKDLGFYGEFIALKWLIAKNFEILAKNYHCYHGELDLVVQKNNSLHFIEVKSSKTSLSPAFSINPKKKTQLYKVAQTYLFRENPPFSWIQFDVITVHFLKTRIVINYYGEAFIPTIIA